MRARRARVWTAAVFASRAAPSSARSSAALLQALWKQSGTAKGSPLIRTIHPFPAYSDPGIRSGAAGAWGGRAECREQPVPCDHRPRQGRSGGGLRPIAASTIWTRQPPGRSMCRRRGGGEPACGSRNPPLCRLKRCAFMGWRAHHRRAAGTTGRRRLCHHSPSCGLSYQLLPSRAIRTCAASGPQLPAE